MLKFFIKLFIFSILFFNLSACLKEKNNQTEFLYYFYKQYLASSNNEIETGNLIKRSCTKNMLEVLDILYSFDEEEGLIIGIDYDPFLNAQDVPSTEGLRIEKQNETDYKVFLWGNTDTGITVTLKKENNNWKIDSLNSYNFEKVKKEVENYWNSKGRSNPKNFSK